MFLIHYNQFARSFGSHILDTYNATNIAIALGRAPVIIYVCANEGFVLRGGWEEQFLSPFTDNPDVGLTSTISTLKKFPTLDLLSREVPEFRKRDWATASPNKPFRYIQGGLFGIRRAMHDEINGFSYRLPHLFTDTEYSYLAQANGWTLAQVADAPSCSSHSEINLTAGLTEGTAAVHPATLNDLPWLDSGKLSLCNICGWHDRHFDNSGNLPMCPNCQSELHHRALYRFVAEALITPADSPNVLIFDSQRALQPLSSYYRNGHFLYRPYSSDLLDEFASQKNWT